LLQLVCVLLVGGWAGRCLWCSGRMFWVVLRGASRLSMRIGCILPRCLGLLGVAWGPLRAATLSTAAVACRAVWSLPLLAASPVCTAPRRS
jgi:hypothetical protein